MKCVRKPRCALDPGKIEGRNSICRGKTFKSATASLRDAVPRNEKIAVDSSGCHPMKTVASVLGSLTTVTC